MEQEQYYPKFIRERKFYTVLPVLVLPFLTLLFWALGGGKVEDTGAAQTPAGFNFNLPEAYLADKPALDKLGFYEQAKKDSLRLAELIRNDPYYQESGIDGARKADSSKLLGLPSRKPSNGGLNSSPYSPAADPQEAKVYQKLDQLTATLNASTDVPPSKAEEFTSSIPKNSVAANSEEMERLENMMRGMDGGSSEDPEMKELNEMLERILDIQHPERVQERLKQTSRENKGQVFAVSAGSTETPVSSLDNINSPGLNAHSSVTASTGGFYSLDDTGSEMPVQNTVEAVIHETQELVNGSTVKLRLVNDVFINGMLIPKDNFLYGMASLDGERLKVEINSLRYQNSLFPVALSVFDLDGLNGIHIPGAISRDAAKQSGDRAIQSIGMTSFDQSVGAQAASAGIELTRNLLSKKVRLIKVTVKAGYQVLLRDEKQAEEQ